MTLKELWNHKITRRVRKIGGVVLRTILTIVLVCVITVSIVGTVATVYIVTSFDGSEGLPDLEAINNNETSFIYTQDENGEWKINQRIQGANQIWTDLEEIPTAMKYAVIAIEDERFEEHEGVDWKRTVSAFANLFLHFSDREYGGSTITQQLIKNVTGNDDHQISRKITEIMQAIELERTVATKDDIIEAYLNILPLSSNIKGVGAAAHAYFAKDVRDLSIAECALIASITQNPSRYNPYVHPENARQRQRVVLSKMYELEFITEDEYYQALGEELVFRSLTQTGNAQTYYADMVIEDVIEDLMKVYGYNYTYAEQLVFYGGLNIYSAEDTVIQQKVQEIYADDKNFPAIKESDEGDNPQGAIVILGYDGRIVATAGQRGPKTADRVSNFAISSTRQCGSAIKPLASYAPALDKNLIHYSSLVRDCYITLPNGKKWPSNAGSKVSDNGNVLLESALQRSLNTVPVRLLQQLGVERSFDFLTNSLGFTSLHKTLAVDGKVLTDMDLAPLGLGGFTNGVTALEVAGGFQIFGNGGVYNVPYSYEKVTRGDEVMLKKPENSVQAISDDTAYIMNRLLQTVITGSRGTAKDIAKNWKDWEVFAKTGTTTDNKDVYFVGGTSRYVAASWFGYKHSKGLDSSQRKYARYLWDDVMQAIHKGEKDSGFTVPDSVVELKYCTKTGLIATDGCKSTAVGVYKKNFIPESCTEHGGTTTDTTTADGSTTAANGASSTDASSTTTSASTAA